MSARVTAYVQGRLSLHHYAIPLRSPECSQVRHYHMLLISFSNSLTCVNRHSPWWLGCESGSVLSRSCTSLRIVTVCVCVCVSVCVCACAHIPIPIRVYVYV